MKYKCTACGYIYDDNVETVKFEDLPADWVCPLCGLGKEFFEKIIDVVSILGGDISDVI